MDTRRTFPFATLVLALTITVIHILRAMDGTYSELVTTTLRISGWASLYNQPWRTLTSPFLHKHLPHFLDNLCFLLLFGWPLERKYGRLVLLGTFFGALITSHVIYINVVGRWLVGISGGVSGLFGFFLIANRRTPWWTTLTHRPRHLLYSANLMFLLIADVIDWPASLGRVANLAHLVGILYGAAFAIALLLVPRLRWRGAVLALPLVLFASLSYSPWQAEWRLVQYGPTLVTTAADCNLESTEKEDSIPATPHLWTHPRRQ